MPSSKQECFHCGLPVPEGSSFSVTIDQVPREMCCAGCEAVAQAIVDNGLTDFYKYRTTNLARPEDLIPVELQVYDNDQLQKTFVTRGNDAVREASLILEGIVCAACVWLNEKHVKQLPGVLDFRINYTTHRASLKWDNDVIKLSEVLSAIASIGYNAHPFDPGRLQAVQKKEKSRFLRRIAVSAMGMMQVMMLAISLYLGEDLGMDANTEKFLRWVSLILTTPVILFASSAFFISAWRDLKRFRLGMDVPVSIAILSAFSASVWATLTGKGEVFYDSVNMFTFFLLVGRYLEMAARHKAGQVAEELVRLLPDSATRLKEGKEEVVPASELELDDRVLVKPGGVVPADGEVLQGVSSVNEALLTGESMPVDKKTGSKLIGGTVNVESPLVMVIEKLGDSTVLSSIVRLLDQAQAEKPDIARLADRIAGWFVLVLLILAVGVFVFWAAQVGSEKAFWVTLSVLVVTCPCALSLATPVAVTTATGALTEQGVLITKGNALETLAKVNHVVFDKTGTLTHGQLKIHEKVFAEGCSPPMCEDLAYSLAMASEHPVARAVQKLSARKLALEDIKAESGKGIQGRYDGCDYRLGNLAYVQELLKQEVPDDFLKAGGTLVFLASGRQWLACFLMHDEIRQEARNVVESLRQLGIKTTLLSGDSEFAVRGVAARVAADSAFGALLPEDKLQKLIGFQQAGDIVAMVGDGVNDAPVLARAQVSLAMGKGSQLAQASADMVLLSENLEHLPEAIAVAREMQWIIHQNFAWAIGYNLLALPLAAAGLIAPWMAAIGMSASSLIVVMNSLRLKKQKEVSL